MSKDLNDERHDLMLKAIINSCVALNSKTRDLRVYTRKYYQGYSTDSYEFAEEKIKQNVQTIKHEAERLVDIINALADVKF